MTGCVRFLQRNGFALVCMAVAVAACWAIELTPGSYAEWGRRRDGVKEAAEKAKEGEIAPLLQWLVLELADPLPEDLPSASHMSLTLSEQIQSRAVAGLVNLPEPTELRKAYNVAVEFEKRLILGLGLRGIASLDEERADEKVLKRCLTLLQDDASDYVRARAASALGKIGIAHPKLVTQIEPALRRALHKDPARRPGELRGEAKFVYPVRRGAWSALTGLGFDLGPVDSWAYSD